MSTYAHGVAPSTGDFLIEPLESVSADDERALRALVAQVSRSARPPASSDLQDIASASATHLLVARDATGGIIGMLTLAVFRIPTGVRAWIEDVAVDERSRGQGVGRRLTQTAADVAFSQGARTVELTSRPSRTAANHLYRSLGFTERETNVYRLSASENHPDAHGQPTPTSAERP